MLSTIEQVLFLRGVDLFDQIPSEDLVRVAQVAHEVHFSAGEKFVAQGDLGDSLYIVVNGETDIVVEGVGKVATRGEKAAIGEMALLSHSPRMASCVAASDMSALKIEREDFQDLLVEKPELAQGIIQVLVQRLEEASQNVANP